MNPGTFPALAALALMLAACATPGPVPGSVTRPIAPEAAHHAFTYCEGWGCETKHSLAFRDEDWQAVRALFAPAPADAADERERITAAISLMEQFAGRDAGTDSDVGGTLTRWRRKGQLDCFSEAANTTTFLHILHNDGLIVHHKIAKPALRYWLFGHPVFGAHATAVLHERETGAAWAIDSWFFDNGGNTVAVELRRWLMGYRPKGGARL